MNLLRKISLLGVALAWSVSLYAQTDSVTMQLNVDDVVVTATQQMFSQSGDGNIHLSTEKLYALPRFGGSVDVLKLLQFTPGVTATADGDQGMFVRGGDMGQNRLLINGAPVYSPSHLFGFFSVFNSSYLGGVSLLKSSIPPQYGSALSSVTDVRTHMLIPQQSTIDGNIGIIESDLATKIRISDRVGLFASARHSYTSWLTSLINNKDNSLKYEFGDYGLGLTANLGRAGMLTINTHFNLDHVNANLSSYDCLGAMRWWDSSSSAILQSRIGERTTMENTIYATLYDNSLNLTLTDNSLSALSGISDFGYRNVTCTTWEQVTLTTGGEYSFRNIRSQQLYSSLTPHREENIRPTPTHEVALYGSAVWRAHQYLNINAGVRLSLFASDKVWVIPEPRIMISVPLNNHRWWAAYNLSTQYIQYVPQSNTGFVTDFFVGATRANPPQWAHNFSLGYSLSSLGGRINLSVEPFYRRMYGVVEYNTNISTMLAGGYSHQDNIYSGEGEAYGVEMGVGYTERKVNVQLNYTLARSMRQFSEINNGKAFVARNDRRHNLSMIALYEPSKCWSLSATFVYASGAAYTAPTAIYTVGGAILKEFGPYNGSRLPDMHRLDLSATWWMPCREGRRSGLNLSIYNIYARNNPLMISWAVYYDHDDSSIIRITKRHHTLSTIIPSISWTFSF